jgi:hypothetical protein
MNDAGRLGVARAEQSVDLALFELVARPFSERIVSGFAQGLAPVIDYFAEGIFVDTVAHEGAVIVAQFQIVTID